MFASSDAKVMTSIRERRSFWQYALAVGLTLLVVPQFGGDRLIGVEYAAGAAITLAALLRLWILKGQRRLDVTRSH